MRRQFQTPDPCPVCGENVPPKARACPNCGADENSGWKDDAYAAGLDLPEEDFDYDEFTKKEFGKETRPRGISKLWWVTALVLLLIICFSYFR